MIKNVRFGTDYSKVTYMYPMPEDIEPAYYERLVDLPRVVWWAYRLGWKLVNWALDYAEPRCNMTEKESTEVLFKDYEKGEDS